MERSWYKNSLNPICSSIALLLFLAGTSRSWAQELDDRYSTIMAMADQTAKSEALAQLKSSMANGKDVVACRGVGGGVYDALRIDYRDGTSAIFKTNDPGQVGPYARSEHEIAAYNVAEFLGIENVPPTVLLEIPYESLKDNPRVNRGSCKRVFEQRIRAGLSIVGSAQFFVSGAKDPVYDDRYVKPSELRLFDYLVFNCDRPGNKNLVMKNGTSFYIDNGMAFLSARKLDKIRASLPVPPRYDDFSNYCQDLLDLDKNPQRACSFVNLYTIAKLQRLGNALPSLLQNLVNGDEISAALTRIGNLVHLCSPAPTVAAGTTPARPAPQNTLYPLFPKTSSLTRSKNGDAVNAVSNLPGAFEQISLNGPRRTCKD